MVGKYGKMLHADTYSQQGTTIRTDPSASFLRCSEESELAVHLVLASSLDQNPLNLQDVKMTGGINIHEAVFFRIGCQGLDSST